MNRIFSDENLKSLKLTEEQQIVFADLQNRWCTLYNVLNGCKLPKGAISGIMAQSNLYKLDLDNLEALKEGIRAEFKDIIL